MSNLTLFKDPLLRDPFVDFFNIFDESPRFLTRTNKRSNIVENDNEYVVKLAVPGLIKDDIEIRAKDSILTILHEKEENNEDFYFTNSFTKQYTLPDDVSVKDIIATVENGILSIKIPKDKKKIKEHVIKIQ